MSGFLNTQGSSTARQTAKRLQELFTYGFGGAGPGRDDAIYYFLKRYASGRFREEQEEARSSSSCCDLTPVSTWSTIMRGINMAVAMALCFAAVECRPLAIQYLSGESRGRYCDQIRYFVYDILDNV